MKPAKKEERLRRRETIRERIKFLLEFRWGDSQSNMAQDLGTTQSLISKIVLGRQGAGKQFLEKLSQQPGVNADWLLLGTGNPFPNREEGTLAVSFALLPGSPHAHLELLSERRHPVAKELNRPTRYWLEIASTSPLLQDPRPKILPGDLLLMDTDRAWTGRLDLVLGRLCGVRYFRENDAVAYALGILGRSPLGLVLDCCTFKIPLGNSMPRPQSSPSARQSEEQERPPDLPEVLEGYNPFEKKRRRTVRNLKVEEARAPARRARAQAEAEAAAQTATARQALEAEAQSHQYLPQPEANVGGLEGIVGTCVYLTRPSPVFS